MLVLTSLPLSHIYMFWIWRARSQSSVDWIADLLIDNTRGSLRKCYSILKSSNQDMGGDGLWSTWVTSCLKAEEVKFNFPIGFDMANEPAQWVHWGNSFVGIFHQASCEKNHFFSSHKVKSDFYLKVVQLTWYFGSMPKIDFKEHIRDGCQ